ncbi:hypothetical protein myaer102_53320 [Microcystis viridis NIES-102]|uniref:PIN domain-containing protein n=1 Tax=Microcystis viridis NIES-102 TaxID=213615 RepID=A0A3G9K8G6_MICVR|nr:PIN domain-containing protein [Microcystis viridis]BBH42670.1 hypothetical protein myaer102_53320 [Microcystis viridis NIES-102]
MSDTPLIKGGGGDPPAYRHPPYQGGQGGSNLKSIFNLIITSYLITVPISLEIAEVAAQLRARQNLRTPDAIQIATAMGEGAMFFLTNDARLAAVPDLKVLVLDAL